MRTVKGTIAITISIGSAQRTFRSSISIPIHQIDAAEKSSGGYGRKGEASPKAKLTEEDVLRIRALHAEGKSYATIAAQFGVSKSGIAHVMKRAWLHV